MPSIRPQHIGAPLGPDEIAAVRDALGVSSPAFEIDGATRTATERARSRGKDLHQTWSEGFDAWATANADAAVRWSTARSPIQPGALDDVLPAFEPGTPMATRDASGKVIQALAASLPQLWGGSADLAEPNRTTIADDGSFLPDESRHGRNIHWGVREHSMAAAMNGIALSGGSRIFGGTFLVFSDYQRPAIRLAALMQLPVTFLWSHDSVALGADGPTHQPIEHLAALRAIPRFSVVRPADAAETAIAWAAVLERGEPAGLVLARQPVTTAATPAAVVSRGVRRGAYRLDDLVEPEALVVATGREVTTAVQAAAELRLSGVDVGVVSMPCREWFDQQPDEYRDAVLPPAVERRVVVEAATRFGWADIAGARGTVVGIDQFGLSAPADEALRARGMTVDGVVAAIRNVLSRP